MTQKILHIIKRSSRAKALFLSVFLISFLSNAQVSSSIDSTYIKIGEEIKYSIIVEADTTDLVVFPEGQSFLPLEVIESYKIDTTYEKAKYRLLKKYGITQFDSGKYTIPSQRIIINNKAFQTDSINVEVADVVVDTTQQKMFTIKPAIEVKKPPFDFIKILYWIVPILLIIAGIVYFLFRRKKRKEEREKELPPYEEALVALQKLDSSHLLEEDKSKEYYSSLTEIIKRYLDHEVDDKALESTSNELIERLELHRDSGNFDFDSETISKLDKIFKRADLIKFAKMKEREGQASVDRSTIEEILNETKEIIPELTEEELLENEQYLELLRKKRNRRKWLIGAASVFTLVIISLGIYGAVKGMDAVKDIFFSNVTKELSEGRWIKSEYGNPAIIIETPEVLLRQEIDPKLLNGIQASDISAFSFGDRTIFNIVVSTFKIQGEQEIDLDAAIEGALSNIEKQGATNLVVKTEEFKTEKGITGKKAYGELNLVSPKGETLPITHKYELLLFAQQGGLQQIMVMYQGNEKYGDVIKKRIMDSVELVISDK
ncbi:MAG: hypothetical protein ACI9SJ_001989 [Flavobacteriaceae bacterium]|jgi:hypothetical protein